MLRKVDWTALSRLLTHLYVQWALVGWMLGSLMIPGQALRWRIFLQIQGIRLPFRNILALTWAGQFFNSMLPGSTGGDVVKVYQLCHLAPNTKAGAAATVLVDRLTAFLALAVLAALALAVDRSPLYFLFTPSPSTNAALACLALLLIAGALVLWHLLVRTRATLWGGRLVRTLEAARGMVRSKGELLLAATMAFALHFLNFTVVYCFAMALGLSITYLQILTIVPVVVFFVMLPVTINGHGLRELLLVGYFSQMGIAGTGRYESSARDIAVALSLLLVANDLFWSTPGGLWYLTRFKSPSLSRSSAPLQDETLHL